MRRDDLGKYFTEPKMAVSATSRARKLMQIRGGADFAVHCLIVHKHGTGPCPAGCVPRVLLNRPEGFVEG